jgi:hypothetical protein
VLTGFTRERRITSGSREDLTPRRLGARLIARPLVGGGEQAEGLDLHGRASLAAQANGGLELGHRVGQSVVIEVHRAERGVRCGFVASEREDAAERPERALLITEREQLIAQRHEGNGIEGTELRAAAQGAGGARIVVPAGEERGERVEGAHVRGARRAHQAIGDGEGLVAAPMGLEQLREGDHVLRPRGDADEGAVALDRRVDVAAAQEDADLAEASFEIAGPGADGPAVGGDGLGVPPQLVEGAGHRQPLFRAARARPLGDERLQGPASPLRIEHELGYLSADARAGGCGAARPLEGGDGVLEAPQLKLRARDLDQERRHHPTIARHFAHDRLVRSHGPLVLAPRGQRPRELPTQMNAARPAPQLSIRARRALVVGQIEAELAEGPRQLFALGGGGRSRAPARGAIGRRRARPAARSSAKSPSSAIQ